MENTQKLEAFKEALKYIKNPEIRKFAQREVELLPDYFFEIPASSTGKYHPAYSLGEGGLLRHTLAAIRISLELFRLDWWHFTEDEKDLIIASIIPHDGWKSGLEHGKFTVAEHPTLAVFALSQDEQLLTILPKEQVDMVFDNIKSHMGQWNTDFKTGEEILEKPKTKYQKFVHLADYLASRKCLLMDFDVPMER